VPNALSIRRVKCYSIEQEVIIKNFLMLFALMTLIMVAPLSLTAAEKKINCCNDRLGKCYRTTYEKCEAEGDKVIKKCSQCKKQEYFGTPFQERGRAR
jgi:hypothetical protein